MWWQLSFHINFCCCRKKIIVPLLITATKIAQKNSTYFTYKITRHNAVIETICQQDIQRELSSVYSFMHHYFTFFEGIMFTLKLLLIMNFKTFIKLKVDSYYHGVSYICRKNCHCLFCFNIFNCSFISEFCFTLCGQSRYQWSKSWQQFRLKKLLQSRHEISFFAL